MTDEHNLPEDQGGALDDYDSDSSAPLAQPPGPPSTNGVVPAKTPVVRSGLAHRRNPVLARLGELAQQGLEMEV